MLIVFSLVLLLVRWISTFLSLLHIHVKFGTIAKLTKKLPEKCKTCNLARLFINLTINERVELLSNTLINIFRNYFSNKKVKFKYGEAPCINKYRKSSLRRRSRFTKRYYVNGQVQSDYNLLLGHSKKCTEMILKK